MSSFVVFVDIRGRHNCVMMCRYCSHGMAYICKPCNERASVMLGIVVPGT